MSGWINGAKNDGGDGSGGLVVAVKTHGHTTGEGMKVARPQQVVPHHRLLLVPGLVSVVKVVVSMVSAAVVAMRSSVVLVVLQ